MNKPLSQCWVPYLCTLPKMHLLIEKTQLKIHSGIRDLQISTDIFNYVYTLNGYIGTRGIHSAP